MSVYNTSFMNNATNPLDLIVGINTVIGEPFLIGNYILLAIFMLSLVFLMRYDLRQAFIASSFITTIVSILLYATGIVAAGTIIIPFIMMIIGLIIYLFT